MNDNEQITGACICFTLLTCEHKQYRLKQAEDISYLFGVFVEVCVTLGCHGVSECFFVWC